MRPRASRPFAPPSTSQAKKKLTLIEPASLKIRLRKQPASQQQPSASSFSGGNDNNGAAAAPAAAAAAHSSYFPSSSAAAPELEVSVSDPVKHGEGVSAYVSYKVQARPISSTTTGGTAGTGTTATTTPASRALAAAPGAVVIRRFRDFQWLRCRLSSTLRGAVVPPLPETSILQKYALSADFIEGRRAALARFANAAAAHPEVRWSEDFAGFLTEAELGRRPWGWAGSGQPPRRASGEEEEEGEETAAAARRKTAMAAAVTGLSSRTGPARAPILRSLPPLPPPRPRGASSPRWQAS